MAATDSIQPTSGQFHAVRFYQDDMSLCRIIAEFLGDGLISRQPALMFATPAHSADTRRELSARSFDVDQLQRTGELVICDAEEALRTFLVNDSIDAQRFSEHMGALIGKASQSDATRTVRVYGEMVDLLWRGSNHRAAVRLEMLWNQLAATHRFSLLCSYSMGFFHKDAAFDAICRAHTHVMSEDGEAVPIGATQTIVRA